MKPTLWLLPLAATAAAANKTLDYDAFPYIDPFIGTANGGDVFAGASLPYGMAKAVADTNAVDNQGGFAMDGSLVTGFSPLHDSGTGGNPSLGNFALFVHPACAGDAIDDCVFPKKARGVGWDNSSVKASPGYFSIKLDSGVVADMTAAHHTALFRFHLPHGSGNGSASGSPLVLLDLTDLSDSRQDNASIAVDRHSGRITGSGRFLPSFGEGSYVGYFCADFGGTPARHLRDTGIFVDSRATAATQSLRISRSINGYPLPGGAWARFANGTDTILARVGVSWRSAAQACSNAEREIPGSSSFDFDRTHAAAAAAWRAKMAPIRVSRTPGVNRSLLTNFYSGIYRTMLNPQDYSGENPLWASDEPYFDSLYCIWDLFRSQLPFLTLVDPPTSARIVRSLIDTQRHLGWLPDCRMALSKGYTQGGSNADNVIADAFVKNLTGGIDWHAAYAAVVRDAEEEPFDWCCEGRGGLDSWRALNYIPVQDLDYVGFGTMTRSVSRTLEYSYNDYAISLLARGLGKTGDAEKYERTSTYWHNLWKPDQTSHLPNGTNTGFTGFFQPRYLNRTWGFQDPLKCSNIDTSGSVCSLQNDAAETFESSIWEYGFFVPHDMAALIALLGGPSAFIRRLDYMHDRAITYIGNEPAFLSVFQYHYAGRPAKSAARAHAYVPASFPPTPAGLPGNDDSGAMGSFVALTMMGFFPNPAQNVYLITPPFFERVEYTSPVTNRTAVVRARGFDPAYRNISIQRATLNGRDYSRNWIGHEFFLHGGELVLDLGLHESAWGTGDADVPPSLSTRERT